MQPNWNNTDVIVGNPQLITLRLLSTNQPCVTGREILVVTWSFPRSSGLWHE